MADRVDHSPPFTVHHVRQGGISKLAAKRYGHGRFQKNRSLFERCEERKAGHLKTTLTKPALSPHEIAVCSENPLQNLYISVDGEVSPCVYLYPPAPSPFKRIFQGKEHHIEKVSFGNIFEEPFESIRNKKEYVEFRNCFARRKQAAEEVCRALLNLKKPESSALHDEPAPCKTCHKMLGF